MTPWGAPVMSTSEKDGKIFHPEYPLLMQHAHSSTLLEHRRGNSASPDPRWAGPPRQHLSRCGTNSAHVCPRHISRRSTRGPHRLPATPLQRRKGREGEGKGGGGEGRVRRPCHPSEGDAREKSLDLPRSRGFSFGIASISKGLVEFWLLNIKIAL